MKKYTTNVEAKSITKIRKLSIAERVGHLKACADYLKMELLILQMELEEKGSKCRIRNIKNRLFSK